MSETVVDKPLRMVSTDRAHFRRISFGLMGLWLAVFLAGYFGGDGYSQTIFWSFAVMGLGLFPIARWFYRSLGGVFPLFEMHAIFYALCFGFSSILMSGGPSPVSDIQRTRALQATFVGMLVMYFAYYFFGEMLFRNHQRLRINTAVRSDKILKIAWILAFVGFGSGNIFRSMLGGLVGQLIEHLATFSVALIFVHLVVAREIKIRTWISFGILMSLWVMFVFASGSIAPVAGPAILIMVVLLNVRKKVFLKIDLFLLIVFIVLNTAKYQMRSITWLGAQSNANFFEKDKILAKIFMQELSLKNTFGPSGSLHNFASRIDHGGLLATVMSMSPELVPFKNGITYAPLATVWIPRALWAGKPVNDFGNVWAHWYGLLYPTDLQTSYNLPWLVEFFVNFGWLGIVGGMFLTGLLFAWLSVFLCDEEANTLEYAVGLSLLVSFWFAESSLALMWGGLVIGAISIVMFFKALPYVSSET